MNRYHYYQWRIWDYALIWIKSDNVEHFLKCTTRSNKQSIDHSVATYSQSVMRSCGIWFRSNAWMHNLLRQNRWMANCKPADRWAGACLNVAIHCTGNCNACAYTNALDISLLGAQVVMIDCLRAFDDRFCDVLQATYSASPTPVQINRDLVTRAVCIPVIGHAIGLDVDWAQQHRYQIRLLKCEGNANRTEQRI